MPEFTVDVTAVRKGALVEFTFLRGGRIGSRTLMLSEIDTRAKFAAWVLAQTIPVGETDTTLQRRFLIEAHQEEHEDPETGRVVLIWVIDNLDNEPLPEDAAREGFTALPGWATWTASEGEQWIEDNVTDLASAKGALKAMTKAIVYLRDYGRVTG